MVSPVGGVGSDEPFLQSFYPTEGEWPDGLFRWSRTEWATVALPGVGRRAVVVELDVRSHRGQHGTQAAPAQLALRTGGPSVTLDLRDKKPVPGAVLKNSRRSVQIRRA